MRFAMQFEGIYPPVITPFKSDHTIDWVGLAAIIEHLIAGGVHGIIVGGTTGEFYALSREERLEQLQRAKDIIGGRLPMIAGVNALNALECPEYAAAARSAGADALLVAAPPYSLPSQDELATHCIAIDSAADLPIMLYNYPDRVGIEMGEEFLRTLRPHKNFCAMKEASGDINRVHLLVSQFPNLQLSIGAEDQALEFFAWGARSWVSPAPNFMVEPIVKLYEICALQGDFEKGRRLMKALLPVMSILEGSGKLIQCVKAACDSLGLPGGVVRPPLQPMDGASKEELLQTLAEAKSAIDEVLRDETNQAGSKVAAF